MTNHSKSENSGLVGFLFREGSALSFAALIWYAVWGGYAPNLGTPERAFRVALIIGLIALTYVALQALTVMNIPRGKGTRYMVDLFLSLIPLAVVALAIALNISGNLPLTFYQRGVIWIGGLASIIDVVFFTWVNMKLNKLTSHIGVLR